MAPHAPHRRVVAVALGSNLGNRVGNIEHALRTLESSADVRIVDTSFLYESSPMYLHDQPQFVNAACLLSTALDGQSLLHLFKSVEASVGRLPTVPNGPRVVDLDLLFDEDRVYHLTDIPQRDLCVPHPKLHEREFVLRPLADIVPDFRHPVVGQTIQVLLGRLPPASPPLQRLMHFPSSACHVGSSHADIQSGSTWALRSRSFLAATLNSTPDSFSDGGENSSQDAALDYVSRSILSGADLIDIGGYSTRPGSSFVSEEEEINRTVPIIQRIRKVHNHIPISIDTFRANVAEACIQAGASCINDVYALTGPHEGVSGVTNKHLTGDAEVPISDGGAMLKVAARSAVPVVLMHSRGQASQNKDYGSFGGSVTEAVRHELGLRVARALQGGIRRWNIILDPGIGFSKSVEDNIMLLRRHKDLTQETAGARSPDDGFLPTSARPSLANYPTLIGASRKGFLAEIIGREKARLHAKERGWATAAAVCASVQQGCDIIRVHDVKEIQDVCKVADAIWSR